MGSRLMMMARRRVSIQSCRSEVRIPVSGSATSSATWATSGFQASRMWASCCASAKSALVCSSKYSAVDWPSAGDGAPRPSMYFMTPCVWPRIRPGGGRHVKKGHDTCPNRGPSRSRRFEIGVRLKHVVRCILWDVQHVLFCAASVIEQFCVAPELVDWLMRACVDDVGSVIRTLDHLALVARSRQENPNCSSLVPGSWPRRSLRAPKLPESWPRVAQQLPKCCCVSGDSAHLPPRFALLWPSVGPLFGQCRPVCAHKSAQTLPKRAKFGLNLDLTLTKIGRCWSIFVSCVPRLAKIGEKNKTGPTRPGKTKLGPKQLLCGSWVTFGCL